MKTGGIARIILIAMAIGIGTATIDLLIGWRPRFGLEAEFQRIIREAPVADHYRESGWDSHDVTGQICDRVDAETLETVGLVASERKYWDKPAETGPPKQVKIWSFKQDEGVFAACHTRSIRSLEIEINTATMACSAKVSVMPNCDP